MNENHGEHHIYQRNVRSGEHTSLNVLAGLVPRRAKVLDLGCGTGALGAYLSETAECVCDGVTLSVQEARQAKAHYRRVEVADLEDVNLPQLFAGERYEVIVCADVLEHLRHPENVLDACLELLTPQGRVLISVPNAGYAGLTLELMHGEFRYRPEGLLDHTHLRFFTRQSLTRFLTEQRWEIDALQVVQRELSDSEFQISPDSLPPAVARYVLALPDALAYQFVALVRPAQHPPATISGPLVTPILQHAVFTAQLYWAEAGQYDEAHKLVAQGHIGTLRQTLSFTLPEYRATAPRLRLDPADRPGFLYLHSLRLYDGQGQICWRWTLAIPESPALLMQPHHEIALGPVLATSPDTCLLLLTGDDPWVELPIPDELLSQCMRLPGSVLEVELGWPMSADYQVLADTTRQLQARASHAENILRHLQHEHRKATQALAQLQPLAAASASLAQQNQEQAFLLEQLKAHIRGLENSRVIRATRPMVRLAQKIRHLLRGSQAHSASAPPPAFPDLQVMPSLQPPDDMAEAAADMQERSASAPTPSAEESGASAAQTLDMPQEATPATTGQATRVDIIIPVYQGLLDTQRCLESVLHSTNEVATQIVVINDASPNDALVQWLRNLAHRESRITLLENDNNLGFVATVNRGMALCPSHDVLLLNSDTEVVGNWLDRLHQAAYRHPEIGTVTPLSNNATICSYPRFCESNELPAGYDTASMDALCAQTNAGATVDIPTAVGFCMYIRRDCLTQTGAFDVEHFGTGYGEENDFCLRAAENGWRHVLALDTFVRHTGGVSFGATKSPREAAALATLQALHPCYEALIQAHLSEDPARPYRDALDLARLRAAAQPRILAVLHGIGGGTRRHVQELAEHFEGRAICLTLTPLADHFVRLAWQDVREGFSRDYHWPTQSAQLLALLQDIGVSHVHYHHLLGVHPEIMLLPEQLGVQYDFTAHDYYSACPQVALVDTDHSYCGERGVQQCTACLAVRPAPTGETIEDWRLRHRLFLNGARYVLAPSLDTARRLLRYFPQANVHHAPHLDLPAPADLPTPILRRMDETSHLRVFVLGALSQIKGADVLKTVAAEAARTEAPIEFHLIGYPNKPMPQQPQASLTIHGAYEDEDLPRLLQRLQPDLVWFPARWPETYSYTLSACLALGLPVLAPDLGAFAERLDNRPGSWIRPWNSTPHDWLGYMLELRERYFVTGEPLRDPVQSVSAADAGAGVALLPWSYDLHYLADLRPSA